ncbi:hypothetical protein ACP70R_045734 [Stipagrostis hirtigluma subsp. patula]
MLSTATRDMSRCKRRLSRIVDTIICERTAELVPKGDEGDLLSILLRLQNSGGLQFRLTDEIIRSVIFDMFVAGSETALTTLEWAMSELMKNPRVLNKAQLEITRTFEGKDHKLSEGDIAKLTYLHLVIKETMRLHAPLQLITRECRETCQVLGYDIPKGTKVLVNMWTIGRDDKYWDDPEVFRPERFENTNVDFKGANFEYIPFGAGRRICPGMMLGLAEMEVALASLLYHFEWKLPNDINSEDLDMTETSSITVRKKANLWLHATPYNP